MFGGLFALGPSSCRRVDLVGQIGETGAAFGPEEPVNLDQPTWNAGPAPSAPSYPPTDDGVRIEQLKNLRRAS